MKEIKPKLKKDKTRTPEWKKEREEMIKAGYPICFTEINDLGEKIPFHCNSCIRRYRASLDHFN